MKELEKLLKDIKIFISEPCSMDHIKNPKLVRRLIEYPRINKVVDRELSSLMYILQFSIVNNIEELRYRNKWISEKIDKIKREMKIDEDILSDLEIKLLLSAQTTFLIKDCKSNYNNNKFKYVKSIIRNIFNAYPFLNNDQIILPLANSIKMVIRNDNYKHEYKIQHIYSPGSDTISFFITCDDEIGRSFYTCNNGKLFTNEVSKLFDI